MKMNILFFTGVLCSLTFADATLTLKTGESASLTVNQPTTVSCEANYPSAKPCFIKESGSETHPYKITYEDGSSVVGMYYMFGGVKETLALLKSIGQCR